jgi:hypothetical protein
MAEKPPRAWWEDAKRREGTTVGAGLKPAPAATMRLANHAGRGYPFCQAPLHFSSQGSVPEYAVEDGDGSYTMGGKSCKIIFCFADVLPNHHPDKAQDIRREETPDAHPGQIVSDELMSP